jgi:hypothetical protein
MVYESIPSSFIEIHNREHVKRIFHELLNFVNAPGHRNQPMRSGRTYLGVGFISRMGGNQKQSCCFYVCSFWADLL